MKHIKNLIFDLDDTLYPKHLGLDKAFQERAISYVKKLYNYDPEKTANAFDVLRNSEYLIYGAKELGIDFVDFISHVCNIDISSIEDNPYLVHKLKSIPHIKIIYTNSTLDHTNDVLNKLKIEQCFFSKFTIEDSDYITKPRTESFTKFLAKYNLNPKECAFFEDNCKNLKEAKSLGMATIWITDKEENYPYIDHKVKTINEALDLLE